MYVQFEEGRYWIDIYDPCPSVDIDRQQRWGNKSLQEAGSFVQEDQEGLLVQP